MDTQAPLLPFGGWYVVLVYDKSMKSQAELMGLDFPKKDVNNADIPDNVKYAKARSIGIKGDVKEYIENVFKPKNVTLYDGYLSLEPPSSGATSIIADFDIKGFVTPKKGKVQGKLVVGGFGSNYGITPNKQEGIFVSKDRTDIDKNRLELVAPYHTNDKKNRDTFFNGSKSYLTVDNDGNYVYNGGKKEYYQGYDLDEFDISNRLEHNQSTLAVRLGEVVLPGLNGSNRVNIPFMGVSIDLYVPKLCYEQKMYDTKGWLGFYNLDGTPKTGVAEPEDVKVVTGERLYYRTEIRNKDELSGDDATKVWVKVNTGRSNSYTANSSGIDNRLTLKGLDGINDAEFVYLQDDTQGVFATQADRASGKNKDVGVDKIYKGKKFNTFKEGELKFYVGKNAGIVGSSGEPEGGDLEKGESAYLEFNATINNTFVYTPIKYTVGYAMDLGDLVVQGPTSIMERCVPKDDNVTISLLNGLKVVNQNFKDYGDTATDKNKTLSQDDRLFTQVAELPFNVNVIFKPDINDVFKRYCVEKNSKGECYYHSDKFDICENYSGIFVKTTDGKCKAKYYKKLPDGTWGIKYLVEGKEKFDGTLQDFPLPGKLYLSAIRTGSGCKYIDDKYKLPFRVDGTRYMNYDTEFMDYQASEKEKVMPIKKVELEDAFDGVTFMFSYFPRGLTSPDTNTTLYAGDWNKTNAVGEYNRDTGEWSDVEFDPADENATQRHYVLLQTEMLYKKYVTGYSLSLSKDDKRELIEKFFEKDKATGEFINADKIKKFDEELEAIKNEINEANTFFGTEMSPDGSFHICDSDSFVVRPAYFTVDMDSADKYVKLIDMNKTDLKDDLTDGSLTKHEGNYRVGGDYGENIDVLSKMLYASSNKGNPVPNYYAVIGGDLGSFRFRQRKSYDLNSLSIKGMEDNATLVETAYREVKTYLKPFISNQCYSGIQNQAFYIERDLKKRKDDSVYSTLGTCANTPTPYNGFKFENGGYVVDKTDDITQDGNRTQRELFGKYVESCKIGSKVFDVEYRKIWDKNAISLSADFGLKKIDILEDGYAQLNRFSPNELIAQGLLEPKDKEKVPAALYTAMLVKDLDAPPLGAIFNYYNVGDVLVSIYDNSWTDNRGDQTFDERKGPDGKYWGSTCVINSTSNKPDEFGKVGCDVGMEKDQYIVLRYLPEKIEVAIAGLNNSQRNIGSDENGTIFGSENIKGGFAFTYFNQPDVADSAYGLKNQALLNAGQLQNLAPLNISADAYISGKVYKNVIATLYDGRKVDVDGTAVARCGFANEFNLNVGFNFDCSNATFSGDLRCADRNVTTLNAEKISAYSYEPFRHKLGEGNYSIPIPDTTQMITEDACRDNSFGFDSRCFKINTRDVNSEYFKNQRPLPLRYAMNIYSDISGDSGVINLEDSSSGLYNPKADIFKILATAFNQGRTVTHSAPGSGASLARVYVNFDRMQKKPHRPVLIQNTDFDITNVSDLNKTITPASFNANYELLKSENAETHSEDISIATMSHDEYRNKIITEHGLDTYNAIGKSAYFVYGKVNEISDGGTAKSRSINTPIPVDIRSMIYCGQRDGCTNLPSGVATLFNGIKADEDDIRANNGFITNDYDVYNAANIANGFAREYKLDKPRITGTRANMTVVGVEATSYLSAEATSSIVRVITHPWFIYSPKDADTGSETDKIYIDSINGYGVGVPQPYNQFKIVFRLQGTWGGHGGRKSDGDIVGNFIISEQDLNSTAISDKETDIKGYGSGRMDW
ncbi:MULTISPECIES: hypothetical protein [unclassified Campylobacter]|uniref:hypothetical protein n=1 Tax=unclassified Campylobacter TaxID=2593542 RepID=UPI0022E9AA97|nr:MULTISPECIES: hypothetical protein [unclassified Campylobacter]MDA3078869.1 hypothetical protein [Campylobacter sp. CS_NA2]MDA3080840.1 hypothetical protein [Campylobacter sp. CS_NA1]WBR51708.1 hypothetical protein PF026_02355 [Campylobacter sp. CS_NA3]